MADATLLNLVLYLPLIGIALLFAVPAKAEGQVRWLTFTVTVLQLVATTVLYLHFDDAIPGLQFETRIPWIPDWGVYYQIGLDGYNVLLVLLTAFLGPLVVAGAFTAIRKEVKLFYAMVLLIQFAMLGTFLAQDLFVFYLFWEAMLIPMFLIIGIWGGERRIYATLKFFLYTAFGSILMLAAVIYLVCSLQETTGVTSFAFADLYRARAAALDPDDPAVGVRAVVRDQGADGAAAHVAAGRARRGADGGIGDPRRRAAEDGDVRLHEARLSPVSRCDRRARPCDHGPGRDLHRVRRVPRARAERHQEDHRLLVDQPPGLRDAGARAASTSSASRAR